MRCILKDWSAPNLQPQPGLESRKTLGTGCWRRALLCCSWISPPWSLCRPLFQDRLGVLWPERERGRAYRKICKESSNCVGNKKVFKALPRPNALHPKARFWKSWPQFSAFGYLVGFLQHLRNQNPLWIYLQLTAKKLEVDFQTSPLKGALYADVNAKLGSGLELWGKDLASVKGFFLLVDTLSSSCIERMKIMKRWWRHNSARLAHDPVRLNYAS